MKLPKRGYSLSQILNFSLLRCFLGCVINKTQKLSERKFQTIFETVFWRESGVCPPCNGKGLRDIQHSMSMVLDTMFHI